MVMLNAALLGFATLVSPSAAPAEPELAAPPQGYFMLNDDSGPHPVPDWAFASPLLDGVSLRGGWAQIEPIYKPDVENPDHRKILELYAKKIKSRTRQARLGRSRNPQGAHGWAFGRSAD
jgi:hypothetical protein